MKTKKNVLSELLQVISEMEFYSNFLDGITETECYESKSEISVTIKTDIDEDKNDGYICIPLHDFKTLMQFENENNCIRIYIQRDSIEFLISIR